MVFPLSIQVLDEADRMLDMGFEPQIRKIVEMIRVSNYYKFKIVLFVLVYFIYFVINRGIVRH